MAAAPAEAPTAMKRVDLLLLLLLPAVMPAAAAVAGSLLLPLLEVVGGGVLLVPLLVSLAAAGAATATTGAVSSPATSTAGAWVATGASSLAGAALTVMLPAGEPLEAPDLGSTGTTETAVTLVLLGAEPSGAGERPGTGDHAAVACCSNSSAAELLEAVVASRIG